MVYVSGIKDSFSTVDWAAVNKAVVEAHSQFFLMAVKRRAWTIVEEIETSIGIIGDR